MVDEAASTADRYGRAHGALSRTGVHTLAAYIAADPEGDE